MSRDEKKSRKNESLPAGGDERFPQDFPLSGKRNEDHAGPLDDGLDDPLPFPDLKPFPAASRIDASFGMPDFDFLPDKPATLANGLDSPIDPAPTDSVSDRVSPAIPLKEGTGWESRANIAKPSSLRARIEMQESDEAYADDLYDNDDELPIEGSGAAKSGARSDANITPFPGTIFQRHDEASSSDALSGSFMSPPVLESASQSLGNEDEEAAAAAEAQDTLADAVQSALRNIYGGQNDQIEETGDLESYVVADALAGPDPAIEAPNWEHSGPGDWRVAAAAADAAQAYQGEQDGEVVLDFLHSPRQQERVAAFTSREPSLGDYAPRALNDDWSEKADIDGSGRVTPFPSRDYRGRAADPEPALIRSTSSSYFEDEGLRPAMEDKWGQPTYAVPQNTRGAITPTYAPSLPAAPDQLPGQVPDSGHLLGAAGLGLIGGIALAGVLAVFVFNSFVDESTQNAADPNAKVVERLAPPQTTSPSAEIVRPAPDVRSIQSAATAPQAAPPVERPASVPAVPVETQRAAALSPADLARPADPGKLRLITQAVSGSTDAPIRLNIGLSEGEVGDALISLKGLPKDAKLSTGIDVGGGQWLLPPSRLKDLTVTAPTSAVGNYQLEVQLLKDDAQTSLSDPAPFSLNIAPTGSGARQIAPTQPTPGAAPSPTGRPDVSRLAALPDEAPAPDTDFLTQMLIRDGNKKMREGDIAAARRFYEQATLSGNPEAALAMGRSYDPTYFEKLNVKTGKPDPAVAFEWYKKALDGGLVTARVKIDALRQWLQR